MENGVFQPGPILPFEKEGHCQVTINDTHVFFTAGTKGNGGETFLLDWTTKEFTILPIIPDNLPNAACGLLKDPLEGPGMLLNPSSADNGLMYLIIYLKYLSIRVKKRRAKRRRRAVRRPAASAGSARASLSDPALLSPLVEKYS